MRAHLFLAFAATTIATVIATASNAFAIPNCRPCPYSCVDLGLGKKDCSFQSQTAGVCCVDLSEKGLAVAQAQQQVLNQQRPSAATDRCPPGFQPSEQKCTERERRAGCKDVRLPSGLGCVRR
jgi:hypothetical protein